VARAGDDGGALAVAIGSVRVEVRKLDAATAHWIAVLARSLEQEGAS
jgi:hypothetical protein